MDRKIIDKKRIDSYIKNKKRESGDRKKRRRIKTDLLVHDLKNPLSIIKAGVTCLVEREEIYGSLSERQRKVLNRILRNTKIAMRLVNDVLEVGRSTEGIINKDRFIISDFVKEPLVEIFDLTDDETAEDIKECVSLGTLKEALSEKNIWLDMDESLWSQDVCLDNRKMRQILTNLLNNALKYRKKRIDLKIDRDEDALLISVRDDGEGIPISYHKKIFKSYFQLGQERKYHARGHGLGLAGVLILVEDMGGKLTLESDVGKGTKFSVKIPLSALENDNTDQEDI
ncbi:MAG: HAMP domain-containing histidine kinase [Deltaproteobacteria bacterium]|nr:HAMP domain-containing histidine kinase [Deltaproteobacteria bacterium]